MPSFAFARLIVRSLCLLAFPAFAQCRYFAGLGPVHSTSQELGGVTSAVSSPSLAWSRPLPNNCARRAVHSLPHTMRCRHTGKASSSASINAVLEAAVVRADVALAAQNPASLRRPRPSPSAAMTTRATAPKAEAHHALRRIAARPEPFGDGRCPTRHFLRPGLPAVAGAPDLGVLVQSRRPPAETTGSTTRRRTSPMASACAINLRHISRAGSERGRPRRPCVLVTKNTRSGSAPIAEQPGQQRVSRIILPDHINIVAGRAVWSRQPAPAIRDQRHDCQCQGCFALTGCAGKNMELAQR